MDKDGNSHMKLAYLIVEGIAIGIAVFCSGAVIALALYSIVRW